ncbi:MAG: hypothetical protein Wins2KO_06350 [Winogradskyella sp.]|jgi:hypothetical protein|tara:strand:+ start:222 stop:392 length:171 start_codon:yes stop_codon:yes gene_type:complete
MEILGFLGLCLILGLIIRKKGDSTMDTLSKGCGCFVTLFVLFMGLMIYIMIEKGDV